MTVEVSGVAQDGTTTFINSRVHNRTRTLTCAGVSGLGGPWSVMLRDRGPALSQTKDGVGNSPHFMRQLSRMRKHTRTLAHMWTRSCTHVHRRKQTRSHTHTHTLSVCDTRFHCVCSLLPAVSVGDCWWAPITLVCHGSVVVFGAQGGSPRVVNVRIRLGAEARASQEAGLLLMRLLAGAVGGRGQETRRPVVGPAPSPSVLSA